MKLMPLSENGKYRDRFFAQVDDEDYEYLNQWNWNVFRSDKDKGTFYAFRLVNRKTLLMHHAIIGKPPKGKVTDHRDRNGLNNQRENIWHCTYTENALNRPNNRPYVCMTIVQKNIIDGTVINIFPSIYEASIITKIEINAICRVVKKKQKHIKGFIFEIFAI